ncbi:tyrosinase family protein [Armatimonas sp.]|uniref:tyrosinase family protein n=1 Tax=Armatimonas sp. TaxID=1872638 RepID=UPI00374D2DA5
MKLCLGKLVMTAAWVVVGALLSVHSHAQDLFMKDNAGDTGFEPSTGIPYVSPDIWVHTSPVAGYNAAPFPSTSVPAWVLAGEAGSTSAEYRDPLYSVPNYIYVRIRNRGSVPSSGQETLKVYWASASTGLAWPSSWDGSTFTTIGTPPRRVLFGNEITAPRKNAANATPAERAEYVQALLRIAATNHPGMSSFPGAKSLWRLQHVTHFGANPPNVGLMYNHGHNTLQNSQIIGGIASQAFLPWHREQMNRFELALQRDYPHVKLLYWNTNTSATSLLTTLFMGNPSGLVGGPLFPALNPFTGTITRNYNGGITGNGANVTLAPFFSNVSLLIEGAYHNGVHGAVGGEMSDPNWSSADPMFYLLHTNVDRLWAQWQRNLLNPREIASPYGVWDSPLLINSTLLNTPMGPWAMTWRFNTSAPPPVEPWTDPTSGVGYFNDKTALAADVTSPPIYDTSLLRIPPVPAGQEIVLQIPWYPPNPVDFGTVSQPEHVCLLARIEPNISTPETSDLGANVTNNNNIAWRNISVVDNFAGAFKTAQVFLQNRGPQVQNTALVFSADETGREFLKSGRVSLNIGKDLAGQWRRAGARGRGVEAVGDTGAVLVTDLPAWLDGIPLGPGARISAQVELSLREDYRPRLFNIRLEQRQGGPEGRLVGGQSFEIDTTRLVLVAPKDPWRLFGQEARGWNQLDFEDVRWKERQLSLGVETDYTQFHPLQRVSAPFRTLFLRRSFLVADPKFIKSLSLELQYADGVAVFLNGRPIFQDNLRQGLPPRPGLQARLPRVIDVPANLLKQGRNMIAVQVNQANRSEGMKIRAALYGNWATPSVPPVVEIKGLRHRVLWPQKAHSLEVTALPGSARLMGVELFVDDQLIGKSDSSSLRANWSPRPGTYRVHAVARDAIGKRADYYSNVVIAENVPPLVVLTTPTYGSRFEQNKIVTAESATEDLDGRVVKVEYYIRDHMLFTSEARKVGESRVAPFRAELEGMLQGEYFLTAVATDDRGAVSPSAPAIIVIGRRMLHGSR